MTPMSPRPAASGRVPDAPTPPLDVIPGETMTTPDHAAARYYAIPDPEIGAVTFWYRARNGRLNPWPRGTDFGPVLWKRPGPGREHVVPGQLVGVHRALWVRDWYERVRGGWLA